MKKILLIGDINIIFTYEFVVKILKRIDDCQIDILNFAPLSEKNRLRDEHLRDLGCHIFYQPRYLFLKRRRFFYPIIRILEAKRYYISRKYDIINIHFPGVDSWIVPHIINHKKKLVTSIYGSDFLRANNRTHKVLDKLFKRSDYITVASAYVKEEISKTHAGRYDDKIRIAKYGSIACEEMHYHLANISNVSSKKTFHIPEDKVVILCGYNASEAQRHIDIINECRKLPVDYQNKIHLLFHCSYGGNDKYINKLSDFLNGTGLSFTLCREYMQGERLSIFRKCADIFINVQPTDVLSASMIEEIEAGAICIVGDWLKYPDLDDIGAYTVKIHDITVLSSALLDIINNIDKYIQETSSKNRDVWKILSWDKDFEIWKDVLH